MGSRVSFPVESLEIISGYLSLEHVGEPRVWGRKRKIALSLGSRVEVMPLRYGESAQMNAGTTPVRRNRRSVRRVCITRSE